MQISGKTAVVTGGASGLGEATVRQIVAQGGRAVILDVQEDKGRALVEALGDAVTYVRTDVTSEEEVSQALDTAIQTYGSFEMVVNCAGIAVAEKTVGKSGPHDLASFSKVLQINLIGTFNVIRLSSEKCNIISRMKRVNKVSSLIQLLWLLMMDRLDRLPTVLQKEALSV